MTILKTILIVIFTLNLSGCYHHVIKNDYGVGHGLMSVGANLAVDRIGKAANLKPKTISVVKIVTASALTYHFYQREKRARDGAPFSSWYDDSQWDAITPTVVNGAVIGIELNKLF